jgi:hypothetical protein
MHNTFIHFHESNYIIAGKSSFSVNYSNINEIRNQFSTLIKFKIQFNPVAMNVIEIIRLKPTLNLFTHNYGFWSEITYNLT